MNNVGSIRLLLIFVLLLFTGRVCLGQQAGGEQSENNFYGKVVDQFASPVSGVSINFGVKYADNDKKPKVKTITLESDAHGLFGRG